MRSLTKQVTGVLSSTALVVAWGCGGGVPSADKSTSEANVTGTVKIHGKAVNNGHVIFDANNISRKVELRKGEIDKEGHYSLKAFTGSNNVTVESKETKGDSNLQNPKNIEVQSGDATVDIDLP
jgi:hypothetical protein